MKKPVKFAFLLCSILICIFANSYHYIIDNRYLLFIYIPIYCFICGFSGILLAKAKRIRLKICHHGAFLLSVFWLSTILTVLYQAGYASYVLPDNYVDYLWNLLVVFIVEGIVFWIGIITVYLSSVQMGIKHRVAGIVCAFFPIINLIVLRSIIKTVFNEVSFEAEKDRLNESRKDQQVCKTKYPILMVHGLFFRDSKYFNYWGRIPKELIKNGATVFFGNHQSALSVPDSANELAERIRNIIAETGCEKVNIIAHSKGGIDCRYAIANSGIRELVASLTTVNTPHRGCEFADYLLTKLPVKVQRNIVKTYNSTLRKLGDESPDFYAAVCDLTASYCTKFDAETKQPEGIYCQSVGSVLTVSHSGKFPFNISHSFVKHFSGPNDGLVSEDSFAWGDKYTLLYPSHKEGISHGDMMDLNRRNIMGFDVREFYVGLVSDLKNRGL